MTTELLYRIAIKTTNSVQPDGSTHWEYETLYCDSDRDEARRVFHQSEVADYHYSYGNKARETVIDVIEDAETNNFSDDVIQSQDF